MIYFNEFYAAMMPFKNLLFLSLTLLGPLLLAQLVAYFGGWRGRPLQFWGRLGVALFLIMTASAHFLDPLSMAQMLPGFIPFRAEIVVLTGFLEVGLALALMVLRRERLVGWAIIAMLIGFLPANIYAALNAIPYGGADMGPSYLLVRMPYQFFLIGFVYWATQTTSTKTHDLLHPQK